MARGQAETRRPYAWADLRLRIVSALALGPAALAILWLGGPAWSALVTFAAVVIAWEWAHLCGATLRSVPGIAFAGALAATGAAVAGGSAEVGLLLVVGGFVLAWAIAAARPWRAARPFSLAGGVIYIGLACIAMIWLRADDVAGLPNLLFLLLVIWASDVGAYAAGRLIGGKRLAPRISPSKTWSGAAGGLLAAVVVGYAMAMALTQPERDAISPWRIALVAALLALVSQLGDLFESAVKRRFGVKDSSRLIPGHGGLLDRLDGFLTGAPAAALLALMLGPGRALWS